MAKEAGGRPCIDKVNRLVRGSQITEEPCDSCPDSVAVREDGHMLPTLYSEQLRAGYSCRKRFGVLRERHQAIFCAMHDQDGGRNLLQRVRGRPCYSDIVICSWQPTSYPVEYAHYHLFDQWSHLRTPGDFSRPSCKASE